MNTFTRTNSSIRTLVATAALVFVCAGAHSANIDWNTWSTVGTELGEGTISSVPPVTVSFSIAGTGSFEAAVADYPSYQPAASYADGTIVNNAPLDTNNIIRLIGGNNNVNSVTFSKPVVDPVMAIWSLGNPSYIAQFDFINATPVLVAGGSNAEYGGSSIYLGTTASTSKDIYGSEGNGTVEFIGTFKSLSWTNPVAENWYGFNVGIAGVATPPVPEPETYALLMVGLGFLGFFAHRRGRRNAQTFA